MSRFFPVSQPPVRSLRAQLFAELRDRFADIQALKQHSSGRLSPAFQHQVAEFHAVAVQYRRLVAEDERGRG